MSKQIKLTPKQKEVIRRMLQDELFIAKNYERSKDIVGVKPYFEGDGMQYGEVSSAVFNQLEATGLIQENVAKRYKVDRVTFFVYEPSPIAKSLFKKYFLCGNEGVIGRSFYASTYDEAVKHFQPNDNVSVLSEDDIAEALNTKG